MRRAGIKFCAVPQRLAPCSFRRHSAHVGVDIGTVAACSHKASANGEMAEALPVAPGSIGRKQRIERGDDPGVIEILGAELVQAHRR